MFPPVLAISFFHGFVREEKTCSGILIDSGRILGCAVFINEHSNGSGILDSQIDCHHFRFGDRTEKDAVSHLDVPFFQFCANDPNFFCQPCIGQFFLFECHSDSIRLRPGKFQNPLYQRVQCFTPLQVFLYEFCHSIYGIKVFRNNVLIRQFHAEFHR